jgi:hypothetical protein
VIKQEADIVKAASRLARTAPESWEQFLGAVYAHTELQITNCIQSPLDSLPAAQGRAQYAARLRELLADCIASADKLEGRSK